MANHFGGRAWCIQNDISSAITSRSDPGGVAIAIGPALSRRVCARLRVASHIGVGVHALRIALFEIRGEELAYCWIVVASDVVIQPCHAVESLAGEPDAGRQCA